ncbi:Hsp70 family protein [Ideonella sp. B7]|uniref:Hsp70 family protein n=1 Tax=Ideonella benzenivorans TaxID=2831643 RepID=UPI001CECEA6E|nr:Hsp70 family protein [Ideonella benzenivorans]MCA6218268.1 Hsp70 family protein [Ideonella benzenivorans]
MTNVPASGHPVPGFCAIDFGTSNSAIALPVAGQRVNLVEVEPGQRTMPTAVFYALEDLAPDEAPQRLYGRAALGAYVEGVEGRLMRSMKSVLGSSLIEQSTDLGEGHAVTFLEVIAGYLRHLKSLAEREAGHALTRAVLGRPVFFVDDDPVRDAQAQAALESAARQVGFTEIGFQFEPIAAALDYEATVAHEQLVLVADIGGGTSDFSVVRVGPERRDRIDRADDILASHGLHVAGTDFDRHVELAAILPLAGYKAKGPAPVGREVPSGVYFDLATWHLINAVYALPRVLELRGMRSFYADARLHQRLMAIVDRRLGHALLSKAEAAKIAVAEGREAAIALDAVEAGLQSVLGEGQALEAIEVDLERIVQTGLETVRLAGVRPDQIDAVYLTGGSTGLAPLAQRIAAPYPNARTVRGDRLASVAQGLGLHAQRVFRGL